MLTRSLARMLPFTLPRTTTDFANKFALTLPVGPTVRTCCRSSILPSTLPSMTRFSPRLTSPSMTTHFPIRVMSSGVCGPPARCLRNLALGPDVPVERHGLDPEFAAELGH